MFLAVIRISYTGYRLEDIPPGALNKLEASKVSLKSSGYDKRSRLMLDTVKIHRRSTLQSDTCSDQSVLHRDLD